MPDMSIKILHLYPDLLNLYGDKGNIATLEKRLKWRGIEAEVVEYTAESKEPDIKSADIIFLGGGSDREMKIVCEGLKAYKSQLSDYIENGGCLIATCGGFELLGKTLYIGDEKTEGLGLLDIYSEQKAGNKRMIGNVVLDCQRIGALVVGFENHSGQMNIGEYDAFGKVIKGYGNDETSGYEGVSYKNVIGTYLHGPLLPKNPKLCDSLLLSAIKNKYPEFSDLKPLDDKWEDTANLFMIKRK